MYLKPNLWNLQVYHTATFKTSIFHSHVYSSHRYNLTATLKEVTGISQPRLKYSQVYLIATIKVVTGISYTTFTLITGELKVIKNFLEY